MAQDSVQVAESQTEVTMNTIHCLMTGAAPMQNRQTSPRAAGVNAQEWLRRLEEVDRVSEGISFVSAASDCMPGPLEDVTNAVSKTFTVPVVTACLPDMRCQTPAKDLPTMPMIDLTSSPIVPVLDSEPSAPAEFSRTQRSFDPLKRGTNLESAVETPSSSPLRDRDANSRIPSMPRKKRRRELEPKTSRLSAVWKSVASTVSERACPRPTFPTDRYSWSVLGAGTPNDAQLAAPRHPYLDVSNRFLDPLDVLWMAGWLPQGRTTPYLGTRRQGFIFVDSGADDVTWLVARRGQAAHTGRGISTESVWIVDTAAYKLCGEWDLANEALYMF